MKKECAGWRENGGGKKRSTPLFEANSFFPEVRKGRDGRSRTVIYAEKKNSEKEVAPLFLGKGRERGDYFN